MTYGKVSLVGAGPGHPDLLTMRAYRTLQQADVVFYDALLSEDFLSVIPTGIPRFHVGKRCSHHTVPQREIEDLLVRWAKKGQHVVRLKGGDPFIFGRGGEELTACLKAQIPCEIVPGLSSLNGVASSIALPLTHREMVRKVMVIEGHTLGQDSKDWQQLAQFEGTLVIFMGSRKTSLIAEKLIEHGLSRTTPMAMVESDSKMQPHAQVRTLEDVISYGMPKAIDGPGIIYIGPTVDLFLQWQASQQVEGAITLTPFISPDQRMKA
ncbi:uroporphyrinogen-III C-methyltransferase [Pseudobacteriovorax antillogorgiicola]|uniref:uroporphyrinogen-III C-methyltransferase n=1 Tax=Pseudobacteriovorax antillogorgiicola TaxID=1513793 RepID=A0A1Y6CNC1_9BACT|nr:uroporphyrinogen-III C-methyltransferase [Pseudobacteriovorax antillogorgiicola]TCS44594.1 uroporphyrinogen-III C-methyltransferase [Pseudobacteriovorax antillogorgiicola]SMF78125.1 uroporphyrinogen-III C-methyltransferase [Pseudobacteriovorax antillogorgiicola]